MQEIALETNTEHLITRETRIQDIQVPRVNTTMDKDSNKESVKHLQDKEKKKANRKALSKPVKQHKPLPPRLKRNLR